MALNQIPGENVYIGGLWSLSNKIALQQARITHVVSVLRRMQSDGPTFNSIQHLVIEVDDYADENLLQHFATAINFIQSALNARGTVLVHCVMGKSRSATICVAYLLHRQPHTLTPEKALAILRKARPMCEPNPGFMEQLALYHQMGCPDDVTGHPLYQRWLSHREIEESVACGQAPEVSSVRFEDELVAGPVESTEPTTEIRCRKCRRILATSSFIIMHTKAKGNNEPRKETASDCAHVFLHMLTWMRSSLFPGQAVPSGSPTPFTVESQSGDDAPLSGRLTCPNPACGSNVGKFAWQGMQCSCGKWVVPAMGLARAKVDVVEKAARNSGNPNPCLGAMGIRLPPHMRPTPPGESSSGTEEAAVSTHQSQL